MRTLLGPLLCLLSIPQSCGRGPEPAAQPGPWEACLRPSALEGVARETAPGLDLQIEGVRVVTGSLGQRGPDVDASGDVLRIAAVGGALTFGAGLPAEQAWPQALAQQLGGSILSAGRRVEALNLGTVGASAADVLALATQRALAWQPWLMVVELDASRAGDAHAIEARLDELRTAATAARCGVLVAVSLPPGEPLDDAGAGVAALRVLIDAARRAGFATLDLRDVLAGDTQSQPGAHATAHAQGLVLEAVKRRLFESGLLTAAFESH